jgi:hypothetical protein
MAAKRRKRLKKAEETGGKEDERNHAEEYFADMVRLLEIEMRGRRTRSATKGELTYIRQSSRVTRSSNLLSP